MCSFLQNLLNDSKPQYLCTPNSLTVYSSDKHSENVDRFCSLPCFALAACYWGTVLQRLLQILCVYVCMRVYVYVFMCVCVLCLYAECVMSLTLSCLGGWWVGGGWGWTRVSVSKRHNIRKHPDTDISPACSQHAFYTRGYNLSIVHIYLYCMKYIV